MRHNCLRGLVSQRGMQSRLTGLLMLTRLVFVRYVFQEDLHEDMYRALLLPTNTTAAELFKLLTEYMSGKLNWSFCVSVCPGRVAAMTGRLSGFTTRVKELTSECESSHCAGWPKNVT